MRAASRWRAGAVVAWVVGAIGAVAPTAFLGEPAAGLTAAAALGLLAVALVAPLLVTPLVATVVCDDDQHQVAAAWHSVGVAPTRRIAGRAVAAARASLRLLLVGALAGLVAGTASAVGGPDPVRFGLAGGPHPTGALLGVGLGLRSWVLGALVGAWSTSALRALVVLLVSLLATGAVASLLYFAPGLRVVFWLTPWSSLWPFDPQSFDSAQFATTVPVPARLASGTAWLAVLAASTVRRRRRVPYPSVGESRRSRS
ncbi:MAG: hypothetical protein ACXWCB_04155 [Acidimicrobiales bacterium]